MCTRHRLSKAAAAALALAALVCLSSQALRADHGRQSVAGTWVTWAEPMPGVRVPLLQTFSPDGTIVSSDVMMFGGLPGVAVRETPLHGVWDHTGRNVITTTNLSLIYDARSSLLVGFARARAMVTFTRANRVEGTAVIEFLPCASPAACPDPQAPDTAWVPFPNLPPSFPVVSTRLQLVELPQ
jgi:hypothetical protein